MTHFISYTSMGLTRDINKYFDLEANTLKEHPLSKVGSILRWHVQELPKKLIHVLHNPRVLTIVLTILAMSAVQYIFYPTATLLGLKIAATWIQSRISYEAVHFALYLSTLAYVVGNGLLAFGRFSNVQAIELLEKKLHPGSFQLHHI